jgi:3-mercaptopyruvate sulfurtransferase SseA
MNIWIRILLLIIIAVIIGLGINQVHPDGIRLQRLLLIFPATYSGETRSVSADSALIQMFEESALFIDIRPAERFNIDHIPAAHSFPYDNQSMSLLKKLTLSSEQKPWIIYDFEGNSKASRHIYRRLIRFHQSIYLLKGGYANWLDRRFPTE